MLNIKFYALDKADYKELTRVVCVCRHNNKWIYSKHKDRQTWEIPGGHIEEGETWLEAANRELYEEVGILKANIKPICLYKISTYGLLCYADIEEMDKLPNYEMDEIGFFEEEPNNLTYPDSHHLFLEKVKEIKKI